MKVAVTGASGFIGRYLLVELARCGAEIVAMTRNAGQLKNLPAQVQIVEMELASPGDHYFTQLGSPDVLIHLAWDGLPNYRERHHFEIELPRQYKFLKSLVTQGLKTLFIAGTCFEYGMQAGMLTETDVPNPDNAYGHAKNTLRRQLEFLRADIPFNLIWGRLFYLYGDGQAANSLYSQLKAAVARQDRTFKMSGGEQLRDYLPITEAVRIMVQLASTGRDLGIVNICSGQPVSIRRLVEDWLKHNNWDIQLNLGYYPYADYEPLAFWGNDEKMKNCVRSIQ